MSPGDDLLALLAKDEIVDAAIKQDVPMDKRQLENLKRLYHRFVSAGKQAPNPLLTRFRNLSVLTIPEVWKGYLDQFGTEPGKVLVDEGEVPEETGLQATPAGALLARSQVVARLKRDRDSDRPVVLFYMLFYLDLTRQLFPNHKLSQRGLGPVLRADVEKILKPLAKHLVGALEENVTANEAFWHWFNQGLKVSILVDKFGPGCLFVLSQHLSDDFLQKLPASGQVHNQLMSDLETRLALPALLEKSRLDTLGSNLRARLLMPYQGLTLQDLTGAGEAGRPGKRRRTGPALLSGSG
ncbi:uncharacterized protein N0V89_011803 [Didymosphaeria variabile]|uniref:Uncharacterized protein n=1 Tax=Didymosphaeria variabile TaxID=1932322 RepID=A0A9W8XB85_9PLEO|nr:uncharacterized protein N0V89_011803 [Didymosphaeria variabile]KAJ4345668.1 hypothetical protein N0V89_011803 [Didymosphaeria variabile]